MWGAGRESRDDLTEWAVWKKHRVPFDEALNMWIDLSVHGGLDEEPYLEEEFKEPDEGGWRWQAG